jgi:Zn-dependent protease
VHIARLQELSRQAQGLEASNPTAAAAVWRQCLRLLPEESSQAQMVRHRAEVLESGGRIRPVAAALGPANTWSSAIVRTGGSMVVSMVVYAYGLGLGWAFAAGFVLLIWVHEMGHVWALRHYKIRGSPPLFVPFVGAVITVPRMANALQEAIVGIGGPVMGTVASLVCFGLYRALHQDMFLELSYWGFLMNLFNLLPIPPLDGGRVTAAVSPWIWPLGLVALLALAVKQFKDSGYSLGGISPGLLLILVLAPPRVWRIIRHREGSAQYYQISRRASQAMGVAYVVLGGVLFVMWRIAGSLGAQ